MLPPHDVAFTDDARSNDGNFMHDNDAFFKSQHANIYDISLTGNQIDVEVMSVKLFNKITTFL